MNERRIFRAAMRGAGDAGPGVGFRAVVFVLLAALPIAYVQCNGCAVSEEDTHGAIRGAGLTRPILDGNDLGACSSWERSRKFAAVNSQGETVFGTVCCGFASKGCTIRWGK